MILKVFSHRMAIQLNTKPCLQIYSTRSFAKNSVYLLFFVIFFGNTVSALEEPKFEIIDSNAIFEIRHYAAYLVAEVTLDGDFTSSKELAEISKLSKELYSEGYSFLYNLSLQK